MIYVCYKTNLFQIKVTTFDCMYVYARALSKSKIGSIVVVIV